MRRTVTLLLWSLVFCAATSAQNTTWSYPVKPGSAEWAAFQSHDEMLAACQIPADVLKSVTTEDLVEICMDYPLIFDAYAYDNLPEGIEKLSAEFYGDCNRWYIQPNGNRADLSVYLGNEDTGGMLRVACAFYEGSTLLYTAYCYVSVYATN